MKKKKKLKYVFPTVETMKLEPGNILAGNIGVPSGDWSIDDGGGGTGVQWRLEH